MHVCILGGGGNVAEAIAANLIAGGHRVSQFRFQEQLSIQGIPERSIRSRARLNQIQYINLSEQSCSLKSESVNWINIEQFSEVDVFIFCFPSYMAEKVGELIGSKLGGKPLINLSDRFLGSYALLSKIHNLFGPSALPSLIVGFNGVPIMALKASREAPTAIYYVKPKHSISWYPQTKEGETEAYKLLSDLFNFEREKLIPYSSMFHLAFENAHCIEHAVVDLHNLKRGKYESNTFLYSDELYQAEVIDKIGEIICERDRVAKRIVGRTFASLKEYDIRVFGSGGNPSVDTAGTSSYRINHRSLSKAPSLLRTAAFGYEDVGWSMVPLESFAKEFEIETPSLSKLIDEWSEYMNCDYRKIGRTIESLHLFENFEKDLKLNDFTQLKWLPGMFSNEKTNVIPFSFGSKNVMQFFHKKTEENEFHKVDDVATRLYDPSQLLDTKVIKQVFNEFRTAVPPIFQNNLVFGFVFGGFAKGYAVKDQDADFFICLYQENNEQIAQFRQWYFDLHKRYGLAPDVEIPGSISTLSHLKEKLNFALSIKIRPIIETSYEKQAIVWADIFSDMKAAKIGNLGELNKFEMLCETLSQKWRKDLINLQKGQIDVEKAKLPLTRLFRQFVTYQKQGDRLIMPDSSEVNMLKAKL